MNKSNVAFTTRRKITAIAVSFVAGAFGLTVVTTSTAQASSVTTIKLYNDKGAWDKYFTAVGNLAKKDIGVGVQPVGYTNEDTYDAIIDASFRTHSKPNVFTWHTGAQLQEIVSQKDVVSTSSIWREGIAKGDLTAGVEKYYTVGGRQYCVPLYVSYYVMYYNKNIFTKYHLSPPSTWSGLLQIAKTLKSHGVTPFYATDVLFSFLWFEQLLVGSNPTLYNNLEQGKASYLSPGVISVMKEWKTLIADGYFTNPAVTTAPQTLLKTGAVAMEPWGTWFTGNMKLVGAPPSSYGMFVIPPENTHLAKLPIIFETGPMCVPTGAPNMSADMSFLKWWTTPAPESYWASVTSDTGADPKAAAPSASIEAIDKYASSPKVQLINRYYEATPAPILNTALSEFGAFMVNPKGYMSDLKTIQAAAAQYWSSHSAS